jgi:hypothetical protein
MGAMRMKMFLFGMLVIWAPSLLILAWLLRDVPEVSLGKQSGHHSRKHPA